MQPVTLPLDERPHPDQSMEWWYFVGHLKPAARPDHPGFTIGFVVLRAKRFVQGAIGLVLFADHAAGARPLRQATGFLARSYAPQGRNGFRFAFTDDLDATRSWTLEASEDFHYSLRLQENAHYTIDLDLRPGLAYRLGDRGIVDYGRDVELAYYVRPHLPASGRLRLPGADPIDVVGHMWLERQWGNEDYTAVGWKYLLIHVSEKEQWIFFRLQHRDRARSEKRFGCRMRDGHLEQFPQAAVEIEDSGSVAGLPVRTRVRVASREVDLRVEPLFADQQYYTPAIAPAFFEGASRVHGEIGGRPVACWGMTEIANYEGSR